MNIQDLTAQKNKLVAQVLDTSSTMNEKAQQLKDTGVFKFYRKIHKGYSLRVTAGDNESLKRALFIQWYSASEPFCLIGIPGSNPWGDGSLSIFQRVRECFLFDISTPLA